LDGQPPPPGTHGPDGTHHTLRLLRDLEEAGYRVRRRMAGGDGRFTVARSVYDTPQLPAAPDPDAPAPDEPCTAAPCPDLPCTDLPCTDLPCTDKPRPEKWRTKTNTELVITESPFEN